MPDDPDIENMDPIMKAWMFHNWLEDYNDEFRLLENQGYLIGSFSNPEAVKKILSDENCEQYISTETEFESALDKADEFMGIKKKPEEQHKKRKKRKIKG